jgi:putative transposase
MAVNACSESTPFCWRIALIGNEQDRSPVNACPLVCYLPGHETTPIISVRKDRLNSKKTHPWYAVPFYSQVLRM